MLMIIHACFVVIAILDIKARCPISPQEKETEQNGEEREQPLNVLSVSRQWRY